MNKIEDVFDFFDLYNPKFFLGPISDDRIKEAETFLDLKFPSSYRKYLRKYGCGNCGSIEIYGITNSYFFTSTVPNAIGLTYNERQSLHLPRNLLIISDSLEGLVVLKITDSCQDAGIFEWIDSDTELIPLSNCFFDYLSHRIENEL